MAPTDGISSFGKPGQEWSLSPQDQARQAIPPIRGYVYQFHRTAEAWINLADDHLLYLEVAEDFAKIAKHPCGLDDVLHATQVKDTRESGSVTLNSGDVLDAIRHLIELQERNPGRTVLLTFLTTSPVGMERKSPLSSGRPGLEAWRIAAIGGDVTEIRDALVSRFPDGPIHQFLTSSPDELLRSRFLSALTFACGEQDWIEIEARNRDTLVRRRNEVRSSVDMARRAYDSILAEVIRTIVSSPTRELGKLAFIECFQSATNIGVPSQLLMDKLEALTVEDATSARRLDDNALKMLARSLLDAGSPLGIQNLFSDAKASSMAALCSITGVDRSVIEPAKTGERDAPRRLAVRALASIDDRKHLVTAVPGNGKTFALRQLADELLAHSDLVPVFLPIGTLETWQQVLTIISDVCPSCDPEGVLRDPRVCVLLDGWSEFATGVHLAERAKAIRVLDGARVIASARQPDKYDSSFTVWTLEKLPPDSVQRAIKLARPDGPAPVPELLDLLRLPLLLSLFLLSETDATRPGELLRQFHNHLARNLPENFSDVLCVAASRTALATDSSYQRFLSEVRHCAAASSISDAGLLLEQLGTIVNRSGQIVPVHDLYWSWLVGCGLLIDDQVATATRHIDTSESLTLALQSGQRAEPKTISQVAEHDLVLAAEIDASRRSPTSLSDLSTAIERGLADPRLSVRSRAGLAGLESERPEYLKRALSIFSETNETNHYIPEWAEAVRPEILWANRSTLTEWIGSPGTASILEVIGKKGGAEWLPWLENLVAAQRVDPGEAVATVLACSPSLPHWAYEHLDALAKSKPWLLRLAAEKASNLELARWLAARYEGIVGDGPRGSGGWFHLNKVLVACGDDAVFQSLLDQFCSMSRRSQELLCYAVADRGSPWIAKFQKAAFASRKKTSEDNPFHRLSEVLAAEIDDATARQWITDGYDNEGWRVLVARHGNAVLPELVAALPESFSDQHYISALANMRHLREAPETIIPEIMKRLRGNMQPMAMQHALEALATAKLPGIRAIVNWIVTHAAGMPAYHIDVSIRLYEAWHQATSQDILVSTQLGTMPYPTWATAFSAARWEDHFTPRLLSKQPEMATEIVLKQFGADDAKAEAVLQQVKGIRTYNVSLFRRMIGVPRLAALIPEVFIGCLDMFSASDLIALLHSEHVKQDMLLFRLSTTSNPLHKPVHEELIKRVLSEDTNLHHNRYIASMLRSYSRHEVLQLLMETTDPSDDRSIWLVREIESVRKQRLMNEALQWIR
uniref:Uncharacterized protein n=1 Tax=Thiomonas intermedia (strain K12) TaxID=75379 RepID=D5X2G8_THIK1